MHELGKFLQHLMDQEGMDRPELVRRSGLTRQHVQQLLTLDEMQMPKPATFEALHRAFPLVPMRAFVLRAAASAGIPVEPTEAPDASNLSNRALLEILSTRLIGESWPGIAGPEDRQLPDDPWTLAAYDREP